MPTPAEQRRVAARLIGLASAAVLFSLAWAGGAAPGSAQQCGQECECPEEECEPTPTPTLTQTSTPTSSPTKSSSPPPPPPPPPSLGTIFIRVAVTGPAADPNQPFVFSDDVPTHDVGNVSVTSSPSTMAGVQPGEYHVRQEGELVPRPARAEGFQSASTLQSVVCTSSQGAADTSSGNVGTATATIDLDGAENVTCTFTNFFPAPPPPPAPSPPAPSPSLSFSPGPPLVPDECPDLSARPASRSASRACPVTLPSEDDDVAGDTLQRGPTTLPTTGSDLGGFVLLAAALVGAGLGLSMLTRKMPHRRRPG